MILRLLDWTHEYSSLASIIGRLIGFVILRGTPAETPLTYLRIACHLHSKELYKSAMKAAVLSYQDFVDDSISGSSPEGGLAAQLRLVRELGGDEELARRIVTTHAKHQIRLNDIHSALENLSMVYYFGEEAFTDRDTRLHRVAEKIFKHW